MANALILATAIGTAMAHASFSCAAFNLRTLCCCFVAKRATRAA